jgi:uncharacterized protein (DUF1501 family)
VTGYTTTDKSLLSKFALRPNLALNPVIDSGTAPSKMLKLWKDGKLAVIQNVGYAESNRSHFRSTDIWNTASDSNVVLSTGWLGRYLQTEYPDYPLGVQAGSDPIAIQIGLGLDPVFQGTKAGMGVAVPDPRNYAAAVSYSDDPAPATHSGKELDFVRQILLQSDAYGDRFKQLFPNKTQPPRNVALYPANNRLAQQLETVAWCIGAGMKTKIYFAQLGGFDTHVEQRSKDPGATGHGQLLAMLSDAISAFQTDLEQRGVADKVIGMTYSEFGRRVNENGSRGTDHGTCAPQFLFGNEINGDVYGDNPNLKDLDVYGDLKWRVDFRQLYAGVLGDWFGVDTPLRKAILLDESGGERFDRQFTVNGTSTRQSLIKTPAAPKSVEELPSHFTLQQNYPNPFNPTTEIAFQLAETSPVRLDIYDARGELRMTVMNEVVQRGSYSIPVDASRLPSGAYYYRLESRGKQLTRKMTLAK